LINATLTNVNLRDAKLEGARLPFYSGLMEGVQLVGATGWVPAEKDLCNAKLKGANLSGCDLEGVNLTNANLEGANLSGANLSNADLSDTNLQGTVLCGANLQGARGGRAATVDVAQASSLKVGTPVVFALTQARGLCLESVTLRSQHGDGYGNDRCPKRMEVLTAPAATGPWTSVVEFTSRQTKTQQTFTVAPGAPMLGGFVQVVVHDTYGGFASVSFMSLQGTSWGSAG
jgi:hypothetical protein